MAAETLVKSTTSRPPTQSHHRSPTGKLKTSLEEEFRPVIWRLAEQSTPDPVQRLMVGMAIKGRVGYLAEQHDPAKDGPLRPYILRQMNAFVADGVVQPSAFMAAISALPGPERLAFVNRYFDRRSMGDIARLLGVQPSSARALLNRAIAEIRSALSVPRPA